MLVDSTSTALTLNVPISTKVVWFSRLLKCLRSLYGKQCGPRSDCSCRSSLFWVHAVCFYTWFVSNVRQLFAADDFSRRHFQMHFFLAALRVKTFYSKNSPLSVGGNVDQKQHWIHAGMNLRNLLGGKLALKERKESYGFTYQFKNIRIV